MKKIFLLAFTLMLGFSVSAQAATADSQDNAKTEYVYDGFWSNWFVSVGGGVKFPLLHHHLDANTAPAFYVAAGQWANPYIGFRGVMSYSHLSGDNAIGANGFMAPNETKMSANNITLSGNVMLNLTAAICGYDSSRFYQLIPYAGAGVSSSFANHTRRVEIVPVVGIYNDFRLSRAFSLSLDLSAECARERYHGSGPAAEGCEVLPIGLTLGLTYNFGGEKAREFKTATESYSYLALLGDYKALEGENADLEDANEAAEAKVASLNEDVKNAKAEAAAAKAAAAKAAAAKAAGWPETLFFQIESSSVSRQDVARLRAVAEGMNNNPNAKYVVEGYSDSATGSADYNQKLSQKRADSVVKTLVDVYGVDADQLQAVGKGGVDHKFSSSIFNRYVSIKAL